jgi:DNA-binding transcriptional LysR family regulator
MLGEFHRAHPGIEILLTSQNNEPLLEAVANGHIDVGIVGSTSRRCRPGSEPVSSPARSSCSPWVATIRSRTAGAPRSANCETNPLSPSSTAPGTARPSRRAFDDAGFLPRVAAEVGELSSLIELAAGGIGAAIIPRAAADGANLAVLEISRPRLHRRRALAWSEAVTSPAGRAFLALAERRVEGHPA